MSITVSAAGFQTTVQDLGMHGYEQLGISPAGAADAYSLRCGNLLVGNQNTDAGLEMTLVGGQYRFNQDALIALTGSRFSAAIDGSGIPYFEALQVSKGQHLELGPTDEGARCYLSVRGGIDVPFALGSKSTSLMMQFGGYKGRTLQNGDKLKIGKPDSTLAPAEISIANVADRSVLRVIPSLQHDWFDSESWDLFINASYTVSQHSNRMGLRLEGPEISPAVQREVLTEGLPLGALQVPGNGRPIISFVDHQTTGGYPKIANIIAADMWKVGQLKPGDKITFTLVSMAEAEKLYLEQESLFMRYQP